MDDIKKIICYQTHLELNDYTLGECPRLEKKLAIWDKIYFRWVPKGFIYEKENKVLMIPAGVSANYVASLTHRPIEMNYSADEYDKMHMTLLVPPRSMLQTESIKFLAGKDQYAPYAKYPQLVLNLDTGEGKTYITIAQMAIKGLRTIIIVTTDKIRQQWKESLLKYTDIDPRKICEFNGSAKCMQIIKWGDRLYRNKTVFITNHATIHSFGENHGWDKVHELFQAMKVGVKVYDECHRNFANIVLTDCYTNTKFTYYLTATFGKSNNDENEVYQLCFNSIPKFEQKKRTKYEGKPWIMYAILYYKTNPTILQISKLKNKYGFDRNAYCNYQLTEDEYFFSTIRQLVQMLVVNKGYKTILLMATINGIEDVSDYIEREFPSITVGRYHSKVKDPVTKAESLDKQLIVSTYKSLGEGADIKGLKAVINTESFKSLIITEQIVGRLREPEDGTGCIYLEIVDKAFSTLRSQQKTRERFLSKIVGRIQVAKV